MMRARAFLFLTAISVGAYVGAESGEPHWMALNRAARNAREAKDYPKLKVILLDLRPLLPGNPRISYLLAATYAHLGQTGLAIAELNSLAQAGLIYDLKTDDDFAPLRGSADFDAVLQRVEANRKPLAHSSFVGKIAEPDLLPEDIAYDAKRRRFLAGSVTQAKIVAADGQLFAKTDWPVMALRVDARRRVLWAATGWAANCARCSAADKDKSALVAFQLDSGAILRRVESPVKGLLGDMTISRQGDLYISESSYGAVLRLKAGSSTVERLDAAGEFPSPQTPALSADELTLFIPDYVRGIAAMDLKTRAVRWVQPAKGVVTGGIDGFYRIGDRFLAVQNGVKPERLVMFSGDFATQEVLEASSPGLGEPTHGTMVGSGFFFIANTGWDTYGDDGKKKPESAAVESEIRRISTLKGARIPAPPSMRATPRKE